MYRAQGFAHATAIHHLHRLRSSEDGQGTVEYIGLILLLAAVMAVVSTKAKGGEIGKTVVETISKTIGEVGKG